MSDTSTFPTQVDTVPPPGANLSANPHSFLHRKLANGLRAVQQYVLTQITAINANGWVTNARIAQGAVTDAKVTVGSLHPNKLQTVAFAHPADISSTGNVSAAGTVTGLHVRAGNGTGNPAFKVQRYGGTLNNLTGAVIPHNIPTGAGTRVIAASFFWKGNSGEAVAITGTGSRVLIDGANIHLVAGPSDAAFRPFVGSIIWTSDVVAW